MQNYFRYVFTILINSYASVFMSQTQATFPSCRQLERWLYAFHLRPLYPKSQNDVLYIPARGWFRELHKYCVEARGQYALHTLARCTDSVSSEYGLRSGRCVHGGHAANVHCHVARILRVGVHCVFTRSRTRRICETRANEIPCAHRFTFCSSRRLSAGDSAFACK